MYEMKRLENGFEYIDVKNSAAHAKIALQGAHIFSFKRSDKELLWLSSESAFERGSAIRGGIPLCWPRFGNLDKSLPQHGFARASLFELIDITEKSDILTVVHMQLRSSQESRKIWNFEFVLDIFFYISDTLEIEMKTGNKDAKEFLLTQAFHTYFAVSDISDVRIYGLDSKLYLNSLTGEETRQKGDILIDKEVDRIYKESEECITLVDKEYEVSINAEYSNSVIVWNPWIEKCTQMSAMSRDAYREFVCIESANALDDFKVVQPNESASLFVKYDFRKLA